MYNKNDPLVNSVKAIMEQNEHRRRVEAKLCEELGIYSRKQLPREHVANYDALLEQRMKEELVGNQHKIDANKNNRVDAHDFKLLRANKETMKEDAEQIDELSKKTLGSYVKKAASDMARQREKRVDTSGTRTDQDKAHNKEFNRKSGIRTAVDKLTREENRSSSDPDFAAPRDPRAPKYKDEIEYKEEPKATMPKNPPMPPRRPPNLEETSHMKKLDELSLDKMNAAKKEAEKRKGMADKGDSPVDKKYAERYGKYVELAKRRMKSKMDEENLDEVSREKLTRYVQKAKSSTKDAYYGDDAPTMGKRKKGIDLALLKKWGDKEHGLPEPKVKATNEEALDEKATPAQQKKIEKVMGEFKKGELNSGSKEGPEVTSRKQAVAIALSQAGLSKKKMEEDFDLDAVMEELSRNLGEEKINEIFSSIFGGSKSTTPAGPGRGARPSVAPLGRGSRGSTGTGVPAAAAAGTGAAAGAAAATTSGSGQSTAQSRAPVSDTPARQPFSTDRQGMNPSIAAAADRATQRASSTTAAAGERDPGTGELKSDAKDLSKLSSSASAASPTARAPSPAARASTSAPSPAARPAAPVAAPEPRSRQMFQAAQDRASSGEDDRAAFFAADKQRTAELRGMQESKSLTSTINKILKG